MPPGSPRNPTPSSRFLALPPHAVCHPGRRLQLFRVVRPPGSARPPGPRAAGPQPGPPPAPRGPSWLAPLLRPGLFAGGFAETASTQHVFRHEASTPVACRIHTAVRRSPANFRALFWHLKRKSRASAVPLPPRCLRLPRTPRPGNRRLRSVSRRLPVLDGVPRSHAWPLRLATSPGVFAGFACCRERRCRIPCRSEPEPPAWTPQGLSPAVRDGAPGCPEQRCHGHLWMAPFLLDTHLRGDCGSSPTPCCAP